MLREVTGEPDPDEEARAGTARALGIPVANDHGDRERGASLETSGP
jgi:hypothetical protein